MFLLLVSVTFYQCVGKDIANHFSTFVEILLKPCRIIAAGIFVSLVAYISS